MMISSIKHLFDAGPHQITGNGVGFKPDILDMDVMEEVLMVRISIQMFISLSTRISGKK